MAQEEKITDKSPNQKDSGLIAPKIKQDWHKFVTFHGQNKHRNWKIKCNFCALEFGGTRSRWKQHILGSKYATEKKQVRKCPIPSLEAKETAKKSIVDRNSMKAAAIIDLSDSALPKDQVLKLKTNVKVALKSPNRSDCSFKKTKISHHFASQELLQVKDYLMKWSLLHAIPDAAMECPFLKAAFLKASKNEIQVPNRHFYRTTGLAEIETKIEVGKVAHIDKMVKDYHATIVTDSWENLKVESYLNFLVIFPRDQGEYIHLQSFYCGTEEKNAEFIFTKFKEVIRHYFRGDENRIGAFVSDSASSMSKLMGYIVQKYPNILCFGCVLHGVNWIFKDSLVAIWVVRMQGQVKILLRVFRRHQRIVALLYKVSKAQFGIEFGLRKPSDTRMMYLYIVVERIVLLNSVLKECCESLVFREEMIKHNKKKLYGDVMEIVSKHPATDSVEVAEVFWADCMRFLFVMEPLYKAGKFADKNEPALCKLYPLIDAASTRMKEVDTSMWEPSFGIRWENNAPNSRKLSLKRGNVLQAAYLLDPSVWNVMPRPAPPSQELEEALYAVLGQLSVDVDHKEEMIVTWNMFVSGDIEELQSSLCLKLAQNLSPFGWWAKYGRSVVQLQSFYESAVKQILSVHHSSNIAEKDFSRRTFIQPKSRASLNSGRAVRMHNVRTGLLKERNSLYKDTGLMQFSRDPTKPPQHNESSPGKFSVIPQLPEEKLDNDFVFIPRSNVLKKKKNKTQHEPDEVDEEVASDGTDELSDEEWTDVSDLEDEDALVEKYYGNLTSEKIDQIERLLEEDSEDEAF